MIIELSNGLDHLFQWDTGQKVKIPDGVPTVHFKWGNDAVSFDAVDGWVEIAPELTQKRGNICLWTYNEDHTLDAAEIPVEKRPKPADYVYTPTEIKTWEALDKRIKALEDGGGVAGVSSINGQTGAVTITAEGLGALTEGNLQSATNAALAQAKASGEFDGAQGPKGDTGPAGPTGPAGAGLDVTGATVGQTVKISAVDENGVPTAWVPVDMASGGGEWNTIVDTTLTESAAYNQEVQLAGYHEVVVYFRLPKVDSVIQLGNSYSPVGQAGLYYGKIGNTAYPWVYRSHAWCDADGNIIDSIMVTGEEGGTGMLLNIRTQATSWKKIYNSMHLDKELPAGTQIWIKAR